MYDKLGDHKSLVLLYVNSFQWDNVRYYYKASAMYGVYIYMSVFDVRLLYSTIVDCVYIYVWYM